MFVRFGFIGRQVNKLAIKSTADKSFIVFVKLGSVVNFPTGRVRKFSSGIITRNLPMINIRTATVGHKIDISAIKNAAKEASTIRMNLGGVIDFPTVLIGELTLRIVTGKLTMPRDAVVIGNQVNISTFKHGTDKPFAVLMDLGSIINFPTAGFRETALGVVTSDLTMMGQRVERGNVGNEIDIASIIHSHMEAFTAGMNVGGVIDFPTIWVGEVTLSIVTSHLTVCSLKVQLIRDEINISAIKDATDESFAVLVKLSRIEHGPTLRFRKFSLSIVARHLTMMGAVVVRDKIDETSIKATVDKSFTVRMNLRGVIQQPTVDTQKLSLGVISEDQTRRCAIVTGHKIDIATIEQGAGVAFTARVNVSGGVEKGDFF